MPDFKMMQNPQEIDALIDLFKREGVRSYLEIGSNYGGSLWRIGSSLPEGSRIIGVDLLTGDNEQSLHQCIWELDQRGYEALCIKGNSTNEKVIAAVRRCGPYDAILIDGDHTREGVFRDWENYSPMGSLVAFHDIAWFRTPSWKGTRIDVPELWNYLRAHYRYEEWRYCPTGKNNGIGVIWTMEGRLPGSPGPV